MNVHTEIPYQTYTNPEIYKTELERFFYTGHWCYVGLACEIPNVGDFKRTTIGERSVIVSRIAMGKNSSADSASFAVVENRCAHRGVAFCVETHGNQKQFTCPYHQWRYDLSGNLLGLPFRGGVRREITIDGKIEKVTQGGMPTDFDLKQNGLTQLRVHHHNGVIFASFDANVEPFETYLGTLLPWFERCFSGKPLTLLGYSRQRIPGNWKLMQENIKDPYHPGLLHTWFNTFGLWRADQKSMMKMDAHHRHAAMISQKNAAAAQDASVTQNVSSFKAHMTLNDANVLDVVPEDWWAGNSACMMTVFPNLICQHNVNSVSTRQIVPVGVGAFDFVWTHFGFADDTPDMTRRRLRQANLFGPAGYVSADDGEVIELSQHGFRHRDDATTKIALDGAGVADTPHMVTETLIRGMYSYYRKVMGEP